MDAQTIKPKTGTTKKDILNYVLLGASIPVHLLYIAPTIKRTATSSPFSSITRFTSCAKSYQRSKWFFAFAAVGFVLLCMGSFLWKETQFLLLGYSAIVFYHINLGYRLRKHDKGNRLVYDSEFEVYEHRSQEGTVAFKNGDIERITLHESGFNTKIVDIHLSNRIIRLTNKLVDFDQIPLLHENGLESRYHAFLFRMPVL